MGANLVHAENIKVTYHRDKKNQQQNNSYTNLTCYSLSLTSIDTSMSSYSHSAIMNSSNACPSTSRQLSSIRLSQHGKQQQQQPHQQQQQQNYRPNVVMAENPKKSYNYMASPNYLQYENTYQKFKNICHNKDVTNFRDNSLNHEQRMIEYRNLDNGNGGGSSSNGNGNGNGNGYPLSNDRFTDLEIKAENTMQSSDDEGGFRQNMLYTKNQFNHLNGMNGAMNGCNGINGNGMGYNFKEMEPLLHGGGPVRESMQKQKYEPPRYANPSALMQNAHNSTDSQNNQSSHSNRFNHQNHHHNQHSHQHQHQHQHQHSHQHQYKQKHGNSPYRKVPPIPPLQPYTKPLPKLPTNIGKFQFILKTSYKIFSLISNILYKIFQTKVPNHQPRTSVGHIHPA